MKKLLLFISFFAFLSLKSVMCIDALEKDIEIGKRIFLGLHPQVQTSCVTCHHLEPQDKFNWKPSALDIAINGINTSDKEFTKSILQPEGKLMGETHKDFKISEENILKIKAYLNHLAENLLPPQQMNINKILVFILLILIIFLAKIDLFFTKKIRFIPLHIFVLCVAGYILIDMVVSEAKQVGLSQEYEPDQPIKFSHKVHAGENGIDCKYCHNLTDESKHAGIPSLSTCMNCHTLIREGTNSGKFEISKISKAINEKTPIDWVKVHNLPDHVFFSHKQHVEIGKITCQQCHGPVETMDRLKQHSDLSMGWCINCHRETDVKMHDNPYYLTFVELHKKANVTVEDLGGNDCIKCHY